MHTNDDPIYSNKFYNVKILKTYVTYLKERHNWSEENIEQLFEICKQDITFLDADDHWFDQSLADLFIATVQKMTGEDKIAYKAGQYLFSSYARGIQGRLLQGMVSPQFFFKNIGKYSLDYSRGAIIQAVQVTASTAILRSTVVEGCDEKSYQCQNRRGMLEAIPPFFKCEHTKIKENKCVHRGDSYCEYLITWENKKKFPKILVVTLVGGLSYLGFFLGTRNAIISFFSGLNIGLLTYFYFSREDFKRLQSLILEKNNALQEAMRLFHRRYEENILKQKVVFEIIQSPSLSSLCETAARSVKDFMKYDRVLIMLADNERNVLKTICAVGFEGNLKDVVEMAEFNIDPNNMLGFFTQVFNTKTPLFIRDTQKKMNQLSLRTQRLLKILGTKAFIAVPIVSSHRVVGVLAVENMDKSKPLIDDDVKLLVEIAKSIGLAISNIKNFETIKRSEKLAKALEEQERQLRKTFQKFIPGEVVSRLRHFGGEFLSVQKRTIDVMFVDIIDFTTFSESCAPEEVVDVLNIYIDEIQKVINRYNGKINKIIGDGLLIYFDEMGSNVLLTGYAILQACFNINVRLAEKGYPAISIGIGAHRGVCTIGYIGTNERLDYTLIGDTVNVASRIEGYTRKTGPNTFCFSSDLIDVADGFEYISKGKVMLKGKKKSVEIFQLLKPVKGKKNNQIAPTFYRKIKELSKDRIEKKMKLDFRQEDSISSNQFN